MAARTRGRDGRDATTGRRTQAERSSATRALLLDATVESLIDLGYSATTTTAIAERAGVSRGAQLHHYPTRAALVVAAVEHLAQKIGSELSRDLDRLRGSDQHRLVALVDVLWAHYESPLFEAWLELAIAARTDSELRRCLAPVERGVRAALERMVGDLFASATKTAGTPHQLVALTFHLLQGLAIERSVLTESPRTRKRREARTIKAWKAIVADQLGLPVALCNTATVM